jgi:asparagine synthase (glutamine-hydrolysing)
VSGIAGVLHHDGRAASAETLSAMSAAIAHRGPDDGAMICEGVIGLAHRMLWSTPESLGERQPVVREGARLRLVADARLDNRTELLAALGLASGSRVCDADIIVSAYERWGTSCVERFVGDFAFALWDGRAHQLFCARDPMGVKPFYFFRSDRLFAFASELKALLALPDVPRDIDPLQVALFIDGTVDDRERTLYKAIHRLPAAHTMTVDAQRVRQTKYWRLDGSREVRYSTSDQYADAFREIFREAVRARLRSAHPVGAALSGGLDSSSIVCMARQLQRSSPSPELHTFSLVFPSLPEKDLTLIDERRYIDSVVSGGGLLPSYVRGDQLSPASDVGALLHHLDEPYAAPNLYLHVALYQAMSERGARVFLDGFDGDTTVSHGFARLNTLIQSGRWDIFEREIRALAMRRGIRPELLLSHFGFPYLALQARRGLWLGWMRTARELTGRFGLSRRGTLLDHGLRAAVPASVRSAYRAIRRREVESTSLLRPALARELRQRKSAGGRDADRDATITERESHVEGLSQPAYQLTLEMADKCAAAVHVEPRYPFFDRRLIEFCVAVPDDEKLAGGWPRLVFRRAMAGILPPEVQWRSDKGNLSPNFHRALRVSQTSAVDTRALSALDPYLDLPALNEMRRRYCDETLTLGRSDDGHTLFRTMVLERWLSQHGSEEDPSCGRVGASASAAA